jgi:hypothetical protein
MKSWVVGRRLKKPMDGVAEASHEMQREVSREKWWWWHRAAGLW